MSLIRETLVHAKNVSWITRIYGDMQGIYIRFRHFTTQHAFFKDFAASVDLSKADPDYWESTYYDIVIPDTDFDAIWKTPTGREHLSKDPANKLKIPNDFYKPWN